uniref:Homeobox domain-containing protein n=1 Tax=Macrostomum lignano TaxID=282301 RepID=A0A1I8FPJ1_9PLAT
QSQLERRCLNSQQSLLTKKEQQRGSPERPDGLTSAVVTLHSRSGSRPFARNRFPDMESTMGVEARRSMGIWFKNRRAKWRKRERYYDSAFKIGAGWRRQRQRQWRH